MQNVAFKKTHLKYRLHDVRHIVSVLMYYITPMGHVINRDLLKQYSSYDMNNRKNCEMWLPLHTLNSAVILLNCLEVKAWMKTYTANKLFHAMAYPYLDTSEIILVEGPPKSLII